MSLADILKRAALATVMAVAGCNTQVETIQPPKEPAKIVQAPTKPLTELIREVKPVSVASLVQSPWRYEPTFKLENYRKSPVLEEDFKKYNGAFDIDPIPAPDFSARTKEGMVLNLRDFTHGREFVLLEFTGYDCFPCMKLMRHLKKFHDNNWEKVEVVSVLHGGEMEWKEYNPEVPYNLLFAAEDISEKYGFSHVPLMLLIQRGKVVSVCNGYNDYARKWLSDIEREVNR